MGTDVLAQVFIWSRMLKCESHVGEVSEILWKFRSGSG